jgi:hypothetical protein
MSENFPDLSQVAVEETRAVLHKYDGDFTAEDIEAGLAGEPIETLIIENGEIVEHIINGAEGGI